MKKIVSLALLLIVATGISNLHAIALFDRFTGMSINAFTARELSMGSVGVVSGAGPLIALRNPATLGLLHNKVGVEFSANIMKNDEDRAYPIFNSFDSYIDDAVYVSNAHVFDNYVGGIFYNWQLTENIKLATAMNFAPFYDFQFKYKEEMRTNENTDSDNEPEKIANNTLEGDGTIFAYAPAVALTLQYPEKLISSFSVGVGVAFLDGDSERDSTIIFTQWAKKRMQGTQDSLEDIRYHIDTKYSGIAPQAGFIVRLGERTNLGFAYTHKAEMSCDYRASGDSVWKDTTIYYPPKFGIGFEYHPRNVWDTKFTIEAMLVKWSEYNSMYEDVVEYAGGLEHIIPHTSIPIRLGFRYQPSGIDKSITMTTFSAGTSIPLPYNLALDLGGAIGKRNYHTPDLFPDGYYAHESLWDTNYNELPVDRANLDKVKDTMINFLATLTWRF
ncbi:MAG: OmpP1/FadL family transporter [Candidatus Cloacimonadia bacterium]